MTIVTNIASRTGAPKRRQSLDDSIASLATRLEAWGFLRVHCSEIVNLQQVSALRRIDDMTVVELSDGQRAQVSRRRVKELKRALGILEVD